MTREEAIKSLRSDNEVLKMLSAYPVLPKLIDKVLESPWCSVKEELPKCDIFLCDRYETVTAHYNADNGGYFIGGRFPDIYTATAIRDMWLYFMPIPELPKEKEEQK